MESEPEKPVRGSDIVWLSLTMRALIVWPLCGCLCGTVVSIGVFWREEYDTSGCERLDFALSYGVPFGTLTGLLFGLMTVWFIRKLGLLTCLLYLGSGTLIAAGIPLFSGQESAPVAAYFMGILGYWIGFCWLMFRVISD